MSRTGANKEPRFDVYARAFIPQSLRSVNQAPANIVPSAPARWIDFQRYVDMFAGTSFLTGGVKSTQEKPFENGSPDKPIDEKSGLHPSNLSPESYSRYLETALEQETAALRRECEEHALYRVPLSKNGSSDPRPSMYALQVPGLREMSLRIEIGDIVQLRQLRFNSNGEAISGSLIKDAKGKPVKLPRHADNQYDSVVWGIDRLRETLSLRVDSLAPRSMLFNVCFTVQSGRLNALSSAVVAAQADVASHESWMRSMLFPEETDGYYQKTLNKTTMNLDLYDGLLNYEQKRAVNTVLNETYGPVPFIISGPPGTGKTKTIVELALQLLSKNKAAHLLVCAPSDPAADTLIQRLSRHLKPSSLLRITAPSRSFPEVPNAVLPFCFVDDGMFSLPPFEELLRCKVVVTTCRDVETLLRARLSNNDLYALEKKLFRAIHPNENPAKPRYVYRGEQPFSVTETRVQPR